MSTVLAKKTRDASRGATKVPTAWTACGGFRRISEYLGGPQMERKASVAVSRVARPAPTTNWVPQKPPSECLTALRHMRSYPTARTQRPVLNVTRKPHFAEDPANFHWRAEEIRAEISGGEPYALEAVMLRVVWKWG